MNQQPGTDHVPREFVLWLDRSDRVRIQEMNPTKSTASPPTRSRTERSLQKKGGVPARRLGRKRSSRSKFAQMSGRVNVMNVVWGREPRSEVRSANRLR
jgi:hypothetical protein